LLRFYDVLYVQLSRVLGLVDRELDEVPGLIGWGHELAVQIGHCELHNQAGIRATDKL
jgi:hypothetical protein